MFDTAVVARANEVYSRLVKKKAQSMVIKDAKDYETGISKRKP